MPDEREVLKDFLELMGKDFDCKKFTPTEKDKAEFLDASKETEQFYFPGVIELHYNVYLFIKK